MTVSARAAAEVRTWSTRRTVAARLDHATNPAMALIIFDEAGSPPLNATITFTGGPADTGVQRGRVRLRSGDRRTSAGDATDAYWVFLEHLARGLRQADPHVEVTPLVTPGPPAVRSAAAGCAGR